MSLEVTFLGHSGVLLSDGTHCLAIDPFLTDNPVAKRSVDDISAEFIGLTHGHEDHMGDALAIAKTNDATVIAAYEICNYFSENGHEKVSPGNHGGKIETAFGWIAFTQAFHSSSFAGRYMGMPCGLVVHMGDKTVYHLGDTGIFSDLSLLGEIYQPDLALVPIGDRFTMGPELATRATEMVAPAMAVPIHYNTWPLIEQDPASFQPTGVEVRVLQPEDSLTL